MYHALWNATLATPRPDGFDFFFFFFGIYFRFQFCHGVGQGARAKFQRPTSFPHIFGAIPNHQGPSVNEHGAGASPAAARAPQAGVHTSAQAQPGIRPFPA